jgi:hypothetical protein
MNDLPLKTTLKDMAFDTAMPQKGHKQLQHTRMSSDGLMEHLIESLGHFFKQKNERPLRKGHVS